MPSDPMPLDIISRIFDPLGLALACPRLRVDMVNALEFGLIAIATL